MAAAPPSPEQERQWERMAAVGIILGLFTLAVGLKLYVGYEKGDASSIDSTINLLVGFVSAIFLYLGLKMRQ